MQVQWDKNKKKLPREKILYNKYNKFKLQDLVDEKFIRAVNEMLNQKRGKDV